MNKFLHDDVYDIAGHLFDDRIDLARLRDAFKEVFVPQCFYCNAALPPDNPIDHVLPWSMVGIDGLANLVLSCRRCNGDKSNAVAVYRHRQLRCSSVTTVFLQAVADEIGWPTGVKRVLRAARGIYRGQPPNAPTWDGFQDQCAVGHRVSAVVGSQLSKG